MGVRITGIEKGSPAEHTDIRIGDILESVNGHKILDVLDYRFYIVDTHLILGILNDTGERRTVRVKKEEYEDIGLNFSSYLMDNKHTCRNHCIFCFIDQLPPGLRESLYFKDDDERLSFLMGNYITLTNLGRREARRIVALHMSPVNVSVHTTNPQLRCMMMGNKNAGKSLFLLREFARAGITINCQIVLCRGINDGAELRRTLNDLAGLYPAVRSVSIVPVGLTRYREGLYPLKAYDAESSLEVIRQAEAFGDGFKEKNGTRLVFPADEFFLKAGIDIPSPDYYEDFAQLENGVGMYALFKDQFLNAVAGLDGIDAKRRVSIATGNAAAPLIRYLVGKICGRLCGLACEVFAIRNDFFGNQVDVSGLVTGGDLILQLQGKQLGEELLIPRNMLRSEGDMFLDSMTVKEVETALGVSIRPVEAEGETLARALAGETDE